MNEHLRLASPPKTTQAADGMLRRRWSLGEVEAMVRAGILDPKERFEMIGGEVVPMSPKGARHEWVKIELNRFFQKHVPENLTVAPETTLRLDDFAFLEPDFCVFARREDLAALRAYDVLLAVEVADTSLAYDLGRKLGVYAAYGLREVWVINAETLVTRIHRKLGGPGFEEVLDLDASQTLTPLHVPALAVCLEALGLKPAKDQSQTT